MTRAHNKLAILLAVVALLPLSALAQEESQGVNQGNYNIKQSFEFGGRITSFTGNDAVYRTFDNLHDGPRLLEHTLQLRSLNHQGWLFDDFFLTSFGYGGDPNAVTRLRAYRNRWYNFSGTFRVDRNQWDYNLLANPLNPTTSNPAFPITFSLHKMETVRRMSDFNLTLAPQSVFRVRLGYNRNIMEGPSLTTFHEGTDVMLFQPWKTTQNSYSFGFDFRGIPRTNISFDQFFQYYKGDTTWQDDPTASPLGVPRFFADLSNGVPVDLGIIFNTAANQPCGTPISGTPPSAAANCNGYVFYDRTGRVRTDYPTSQISLQSSYFSGLDLSARASYSSSDSDVLGYQEGYVGLVTRTRQRVFGIDGPSETKRVSVTADLGLTWMPPDQDKLRFVDTFHFAHFRLPGFFDLTECSLFPVSGGGSMIVNPAQYSGQAAIPARCAAVLAATGTSTTSTATPSHVSSSPADVANETFSTFTGQDMQQNQFEVLYDFTRRVQGRVGYRYTKRLIRHGKLLAEDLLYFPGTAIRGACNIGTSSAPVQNPDCVVQPDGVSLGFTSDFEGEVEETEINEHVGLLGFSARPVDELRIIFDMELASASNAFTRISPRQFQLYRFRSQYRPVHWFNTGFMFNLLEKRNNVEEVFHKQHSRTYGFNATIEPNQKFLFDFGYDFNDIFSQTNICFVGSVQPPGTSACPTAAALLQQISLYDQDTHFGYFNLMWRPVKRIRTSFGYNLVSTSGETLILTPNAPSGPLRFNYHKPYAGIDFDLTQGFTFRSNWGYYGYNEKAAADPTTAARDFRGNLVTLSIRYAF